MVQVTILSSSSAVVVMLASSKLGVGEDRYWR